MPQASRSRFVSCLIVALVLGCQAQQAAAQVVKGSISGTVVDSGGAVIPGASIEATSQSTGEQYTTVTDQTGLFHLALVSIGAYKVAISKEGFKRLTLDEVVVQASRDAGLGSLTLEVGQFTIRIEVTAAPPLLENTQAQVNTSFSSSTLQTFPGLALNLGLDFLALQAPGVVNSRDLGTFANRNGVGFAVNGLRSRNNDQQIDGQNNNDNSVAGPAIIMTNPDFIQEYQIITSNFGPEYGRNSASVVNIITKSGTNQWHGDLFASEGNSRLNSLTNVQKAFQGLHSVPSFNNEYSGVSVGGPLKKDKAFIFGGFDDNIIPGSSVYSTGSFTPTPAGLAQLAACFPNSPSIAALATYGPYGIKGGNPVPNGTPSIRSLLAP